MKKFARVVIVGAGFGGLQAAQSLANTETEVILIDRHNYHTFIPLLYQVATAQLAPEQVAIPIRNLLRRTSNVSFLQAEVKQIDFVAQEIKTSSQIITYDYLVLATGSRSQFFGVKGAKNYAFELKTLSHAVKLRNHLLHCFELAESELEREKRQQLLTIAIVGGGATGVELAGALVELIKDSLHKDYPRLNLQEVNLIVLQSGERLLTEFPRQLGIYTLKKLRRLGVKVMLRSKVCAVSPQGLELSDHTFFPAATVIWAVGVEGAIPKSFPFPQTAKQKKIIVLPTLQLADYPQVFAIGDLASLASQSKSLSGVAPEALQQGVYVARAIQQQLRNKKLQPFNYFNKGRLAIIGCYSGVGQIGIFKLKGFFPWFFWLAVHLVYFPDWRNRFLNLFTWLHNYILRDRAVRLIFTSPQFISNLNQVSANINH